MSPPPSFAQVAQAATACGLQLRGGFHPTPIDQVPDPDPGRVCATLILLGNTGGAMWPAFRAAAIASSSAHPLNTWSEQVVGALAERFGATALYPFGGPPYQPFIRWAQRAEQVWPSPIGPLIHARYGLWHAYRGALAFADELALPAQVPATRPCDSCADKPCLSTCPVGAFSTTGYDVPNCVAHIDTNAGQDCLHAGCLARRACPVGAEHYYGAEQAGFHMQAFLTSRRIGKLPD